jgi:hypothetical protein
MTIASLTQGSLFMWFGLAIGAAPLVGAVVYTVRPTEQRLALMRPLSLAAIFATIANLLLAEANALHYAGSAPSDSPPVLQLVAEAFIPAFIGFALLTVAWLVMAIASRRQ